MIDQVLFWGGKNFIQFGVMNKLKNKYDCEFYAIIDGTEHTKTFFQKQQMFKLKKLWYYADNVSITNEEPDLEYLRSFEKKYEVNLWGIAYTERLFDPQFNQYFRYSRNQILSLIEQECKFFVNVINEIKPDFLLINNITRHNTYLLYKICKRLEINVITLEPTHFQNGWIVTTELDKIIEIDEYRKIPLNKKRNFEELQNYLKKYKLSPYESKFNTRYKTSKLDKIKAVTKFLFSDDQASNKHFSTYGRTRKNVLTKGTATMHSLKRKKRASFINKNFDRCPYNGNPFIYFPLSLEPERNMLMVATFYTNQVSLITNIAKSLPVDYYLFVTEHPGMEVVGWRDVSFYQQILDLPNVKLIHPSLSHEDIIKKCSLVITIRGSTGLEGAFYGKPSILFNDVSGYSELSFVYTLKQIEDLPSAIRSWLNKDVDISELNKYIDYIEKVSVEFDLTGFTSELANRFKYQTGYQKKVVINPIDMESFLKEYEQPFEKLSDKYIEKMNEVKRRKKQ